jgi:hypothetical protein
MLVENTLAYSIGASILTKNGGSNFNRDEAVPFVIYLGNAGGVVGLFMGLSLVSILQNFLHLQFTKVCNDLKCLYRGRPLRLGVDLIKLFWGKFAPTF